MRLRALDRKGVAHVIELSDIPVHFSNNDILLLNRPGTPLLRADTLARGLDDKDIFEYDIVKDKDTGKFLGYVIYIDKFYLCMSDTGELIQLTDESNYKYITCHKLPKKEAVWKKRVPIMLVCENRTFALKRMMFSKDDKVVIYMKKGRKNPSIDSVKFYALELNGTSYGYGDKLGKGTIVLHNFKPMLKTNIGSYVEIEGGL